MPLRAIGLIALLTMPVFAADPVPSAIALYNGTWRITRKDQQPEELVNRCTQFSKFFACEQTVNGIVVSLVVYVPSSTGGEYHTQSILPGGRAAGLGSLVINGNTWTFSNSWNQGGGKSTYYRTINVFSGKDKIHFEQQESTDRNAWKTTGSGDEVRIAQGKLTIAR
jgi:hypothetical protein